MANKSLVGQCVVVKRFGTAQLILDRLGLGAERLIDDFSLTSDFTLDFFERSFSFSHDILVIFVLAVAIAYLVRQFTGTSHQSLLGKKFKRLQVNYCGRATELKITIFKNYLLP